MAPFHPRHRLVGLVVKLPPREPQTRVRFPLWPWIFPRSSHTSHLTLSTSVATLTGAWRSRLRSRAGPRVSSGTGWPGVSKLLSQWGITYNCVSRPIPKILLRVAGTLNNDQQSNNPPVPVSHRDCITESVFCCLCPTGFVSCMSARVCFTKFALSSFQHVFLPLCFIFINYMPMFILQRACFSLCFCLAVFLYNRI